MFESFGNTVKIKSSTETDKLNLTNKIGIVYGKTSPSITDVKVIGSPKNDSAINVYFEDLEQSLWFNEDLLEEIENGEGMVMTLDGVDQKWTKDENGNWLEENLKKTKKWWQF